MKFRAAVIGCGTIGTGITGRWAAGISTHAGAYRACGATELVAVCDVKKARAGRSARAWGVAAYTDLATLLERENPEIVSICTPDAAHAKVLRTVLCHAGVKAVLAEKPIAERVRDAERIVRLAHQSGVTLAVNYSRRYSPEHRRIKEMIAAGKLGRLQKIHGFYTKGLLHNGTHWLDLARWFFGEIRLVRGFGPAPSKGADADIDVQMEFDRGVTAFLQCADARAFSLFEMDIVGTRGRVRLTESGHCIEFYQVGSNPRYRGYKALRLSDTANADLGRTTLAAVQDLAASLRRAQHPLCSGADGLAALQAAASALASARTGKPARPGHAA